MKKILFENNKNVISVNLKEIRIAKKITQGTLAAKMQTLGISIDQQMISKIENNMRFVTDYELAGFCKVLNIKLEDLFQDFFERYAAVLKTDIS